MIATKIHMSSVASRAEVRSKRTLCNIGGLMCVYRQKVAGARDSTRRDRNRYLCRINNISIAKRPPQRTQYLHRNESSIRQSIPINLRLTDWIDAKIARRRIGLIEVPSLNQAQSIRQSGLIVDNCDVLPPTTTFQQLLPPRPYSIPPMVEPSPSISPLVQASLSSTN